MAAKQCAFQWQFGKQFQSCPVIRSYRQPQQMIGNVWLPIYV